MRLLCSGKKGWMDGWMDGWDVQDAMSELKAAVLREGRIDGWDIQDAMGELTTHE